MSTFSPLSAKSPRRYDLDWLRIIAFGVLVFFHSAVLFLPEGIPNILNDEPSLELSAGVAFFHHFRLALLFLVSGMGVRFALRKRTGSKYLSERSQRLLLPLLFGIAVVVPPMIYLENLHNGAFDGSFFDFYPTFFTSGVYPEGNLTWHHYWFIAYLYLFCLLTWPLFRSWLGHRQEQLKRITDWAAHGHRIYWLILPLFLIELVLRPIFPGFRDLVSDWASFMHWLLIFVAGFGMAHNLALVDRCKELRYCSISLGIAASALLFGLFYDFEAASFELRREFTFENAVAFFGFSVFRIVSAWAWLLTCVGFATRYLNRPSRTVAYLNGAVYPLFCLHLTTIVAIAFWVLPMDLPIIAKYFVISLGTFVAVFALYEFIIRRIGAIGLLLGAKISPIRERPDLMRHLR